MIPASTYTGIDIVSRPRKMTIRSPAVAISIMPSAENNSSE
jgi:hypothetical protein